MIEKSADAGVPTLFQRLVDAGREAREAFQMVKETILGSRNKDEQEARDCDEIGEHDLAQNLRRND